MPVRMWAFWACLYGFIGWSAWSDAPSGLKDPVVGTSITLICVVCMGLQYLIWREHRHEMQRLEEMREELRKIKP